MSAGIFVHYFAFKSTITMWSILVEALIAVITIYYCFQFFQPADSFMKTDSFTFFNKYKADIYIIRLYRKVVDFCQTQCFNDVVSTKGY